MRFSIFGYYGQGNAGDEAILSALIDGIKQRFVSADIGVYTASVLETERNYKVKGLRFFGIDPMSLIRGVLMADRLLYVKSVIHFFRSDVILIGGGGLFVDSPETNEWIYGYINLIHRAKRFGKGCSYGYKR
ncbi:MAG: polysaccharide pyruvyl transferase family protein [Cellvibrio sp.]|nr:polysaccharide pyruvyl transferase family protein [Cellvibrio sp.]